MKSSEIDQNDIKTLLLASFASITTDDCTGWIHHPFFYTEQKESIIGFLRTLKVIIIIFHIKFHRHRVVAKKRICS